MLMYLGHIVSLTLYLFVILTTLSCAKALLTEGTNLRGQPLIIAIIFIVSLSLQATTFIGLQIDWIFEDYNTLVGDATAYAWLAFDYFNGFALLSFATLVRIYLGWKEPENT